jgi:hypothetical protein
MKKTILAVSLALIAGSAFADGYGGSAANTNSVVAAGGLSVVGAAAGSYSGRGTGPSSSLSYASQSSNSAAYAGNAVTTYSERNWTPEVETRSTNYNFTFEKCNPVLTKTVTETETRSGNNIDGMSVTSFGGASSSTQSNAWNKSDGFATGGAIAGGASGAGYLANAENKNSHHDYDRRSNDDENLNGKFDQFTVGASISGSAAIAGKNDWAWAADGSKVSSDATVTLEKETQWTKTETETDVSKATGWFAPFKPVSSSESEKFTKVEINKVATEQNGEALAGAATDAGGDGKAFAGSAAGAISGGYVILGNEQDHHNMVPVNAYSPK